MTMGARQREMYPRMQLRQVPHGLPPGIRTRCPGFHAGGTCSPTRSMTPADSWPGVTRGRGGGGSEPSIRWTSDRQMPHAFTRTSTSPGPGSGIGTFSSVNFLVEKSKIAVCIVFMVALLLNSFKSHAWVYGTSYLLVKNRTYRPISLMIYSSSRYC